MGQRVIIIKVRVKLEKRRAGNRASNEFIGFIRAMLRNCMGFRGRIKKVIEAKR